jgi:hypothetical protein
MVRGIKATFVILFLSMIWAPTLADRFHVSGIASLNENRIRVSRPSDLRALLVEGAPFARQYENYFNDSFGLRDLLIRVKHQIDYSVFGESDKVLIGKEGWLFYRSVDDELVYVETSARPHLEELFTRLAALNAALAARGITLVVVPCPMNATVYPEMTPRTAARRPKTTAFDLYRSFLHAHPEIVSIDPQPLLTAFKKRMPAYYKTDFHWTDPAAAYIAKDLVNELGERSGVGALWAQPIEVEWRKESNGGEASALGLLWPPVEEQLHLKQDGIRPAVGRFTSFAANEWIYEADAARGSSLIPPTVLFGDSFSDAFDRAGARAYFRRLEKYYIYDFARKYPAIRPDTRFVVIEHIETVLNQMATDAFWPDLAAAASIPAVSEHEPAPLAVVASMSPGVGGTLSADPDPVVVCSRTGVGATTIAWRASRSRSVEVHVGAPDGALFARGGSSGTSRTGEWVSAGTTFYLQDVEGGAPLTSASTLATLSVGTVAGPCAP